jgi:hypothetical protein
MQMPSIPGFQKSDKVRILRYVYLYLITAISIILIIISAIGFINLILKNYVLGVKDWNELQSPALYECSDGTLFPIAVAPDQQGMTPAKIAAPVSAATSILTEEQKAAKKSECIAQATERNHLQAVNTTKQDIANNLAMLLVALPLYLYHWSLIRKEGNK